jgi:hypothetical protein
MTTNCSNCGEPVTVVPAGISKKTGNAYGSFWKCKACGTGASVGPKPENVRPLGEIESFIPTQDLSDLVPTMTNNDRSEFDRMEDKLDSALRGLQKIYDYIRETDAKVDDGEKPY